MSNTHKPKLVRQFEDALDAISQSHRSAVRTQDELANIVRSASKTLKAQGHEVPLLEIAQGIAKAGTDRADMPPERTAETLVKLYVISKE